MSSLKTTHRWAVAQQNPELEKELSAGLGIPGLVARIMVAHGIGSIKAVSYTHLRAHET